MNYSQIAILFTQGTIVACVILLLFRLRKQLGIGLLLACLGLFQFLQIFISSSVNVSISNNFFVSPGSTVLFTATVFALLIIYIKEDAQETKKVIYTLLIVNLIVTILLQLFGWNLSEISVNKPFIVLANLFEGRIWFIFIGTLALFLDSLLIIVTFEFIARKVRFLFLQICFTMLIVISFDTIFFSILAFWNSENLDAILISGIISKGVFAIFYSILFYIYLRFIESSKKEINIFKIKDVFQPLTYKQKFESAKKDAISANRESISKLNEAEKLAKIGSWFFTPSTKEVEWSEETFRIYGLDPKKGVPDFDTLVSLIHKDDKEFVLEAVNLGKPFDIKHKIYVQNNEHKWIRSICKPMFDDNGQLINLSGSYQDITQMMLDKKEIEEYQTSLQKLTTEITMIEEKQKHEIATNIHDNLSQSLVISKMRITKLKKNPALKLIDEDLQFIESHISDALENSRKITFELSPSILYRLGIIDALSLLIEYLETTYEIKFKFISRIINIKLTDLKSIILYRSIQEVLTNAIKHAKASLVTVTFDKDELGVNILIVDNGVGFDTSSINNHRNHSGSGFGLFAVQERIRNIQGLFTITSEINTGTTVQIFIPLNL